MTPSSKSALLEKRQASRLLESIHESVIGNDLAALSSHLEVARSFLSQAQDRLGLEVLFRQTLKEDLNSALRGQGRDGIVGKLFHTLQDMGALTLDREVMMNVMTYAVVQGLGPLMVHCHTYWSSLLNSKDKERLMWIALQRQNLVAYQTFMAWKHNAPPPVNAADVQTTLPEAFNIREPYSRDGLGEMCSTLPIAIQYHYLLEECRYAQHPTEQRVVYQSVWNALSVYAGNVSFNHTHGRRADPQQLGTKLTSDRSSIMNILDLADSLRQHGPWMVNGVDESPSSAIQFAQHTQILRKMAAVAASFQPISENDSTGIAKQVLHRVVDHVLSGEVSETCWKFLAEAALQPNLPVTYREKNPTAILVLLQCLCQRLPASHKFWEDILEDFLSDSASEIAALRAQASKALLLREVPQDHQPRRPLKL